MPRRLGPAVVVAGLVLAAAPAAEAKISVPLGGRTLEAGQRIELR